MKATTKKQMVHIVEYYKNNELIKVEDIANDIQDISTHWEVLKNIASRFDNGFVELPSYIMVSKTAMPEYEYMINKIIERIETI
jgi:hypothetical protein